jgi:hypothetical protein
MPFSLLYRKEREPLHTVAFYNLENLFDTKDDSRTLDDDFTPGGSMAWTAGRYGNKIRKLGNTIARLGKSTSRELPVLVGVAEAENRKVLNDLTASRALSGGGYAIVHFDSPDERGIDTALLYRTAFFEVERAEPLPLLLLDQDGRRDTTRDILYVKGRLLGEGIHLFINHWPSRRAGEEVTAPKRMKAAETIVRHMSALEGTSATPNYILMGDFNDGPDADSVRWLTREANLFNPMERLHLNSRGSAHYKTSWSLFDQILVSHTFFDHNTGTHSFAHADIFDPRFLREWQGRYKGNPFRTFAGRRYLGGYSDHFPVYLQLKFNTG